MRPSPITPISVLTPPAILGDCCGNCRFFKLLAGPPGQPVPMVCKRFPPAFTMLAVPAIPPGMIPKRGEPVPMTFINQSVFPVVEDSNWCGEFAAAVAP
jgi:hypothetical protein